MLNSPEPAEILSLQIMEVDKPQFVEEKGHPFGGPTT